MSGSCCCLTADEEKQTFGCILFHLQCGCCPIKCCDYDNDGMCWGCVCCGCQVDPCWGPRQIAHCFFAICPCGCIAKETLFCVCCCNPGKETVDPKEAQKSAQKALAKQDAKK